MSSVIGEKIKISLFGQSHSEGIGIVIDGLPAGEKLDFEQIYRFMARRAPGQGNHTTARRETDIPRVLSGIVEGVTCGAPVACVIENSDKKSSDYENLRFVPRPGHSDFAAFQKYGNYHDIRGGGHFSGRLTAPLCFAGAICIQLLEKRGVTVGAHIASVADVSDTLWNPANITCEQLLSASCREFPVVDPDAGEKMKESIALAKSCGDSVGGIIECAAAGVPAGLGDPMFGGVENRIAAAVFGIPAVKGIEFGAGFKSAFLRGSENNDEFCLSGDEVKTKSNNHGGILGGITTGMPVIFRAAFKPTPSIENTQKSVNLKTREEIDLQIAGRHDPCIVPRAVPAVESAAAVVLLDLMLDSGR